MFTKGLRGRTCAREATVSEASGGRRDSGALKLPPPGAYTSAHTLFTELESPVDGGPPPVRLVKLSWLLDRADKLAQASTDEDRRALALPARQDLEADEGDEAFLSLDELKALPREEWQGEPKGKLAIFSASHAWLTPGHPDPEGEKLKALVAAIRSLSHSWLSHPLPAEAGVFIDWCSLHQSKALHGGRTPEQQAAFSHALSHMQVWYAHTLVTTFLLRGWPTVPRDPSTESVGYADRGWTTCELRWSSLAKQSSKHAWPPIIEVGSNRRGQAAVAFREPPLTPAAMARLVAAKRFTSQKADLPMVLLLNVLTIMSVLGDASELFYAGLEWSNAEVVSLAQALPMCSHLTELSLARNRIGAEGVRALTSAFPNVPNLQVLMLSDNRLGNDGVAAFAEGLRSGALRALRILYLEKNGIDEEGFVSLASALTASQQQEPPMCLSELYLNNNLGGDGGATALAGALQGIPGSKLTTLCLGGNGLADEAANAFAAAFKAGGLPSLETLNLIGNLIGSPGCSAIAGALADGGGPALTSLILDNNNMSLEDLTGAEALVKAVHARRNAEPGEATLAVNLTVELHGNNVKAIYGEWDEVEESCRSSRIIHHYGKVGTEDVVAKAFEELLNAVPGVAAA